MNTTVFTTNACNSKLIALLDHYKVITKQQQQKQL